ncbi:hypothetical protein I7I50_03332 [Histoplasma capsulatum G186AR]|uniref:Uncharacterized protein n=1 Tax=Ajellomyces capsulatus TaxID=5037 RepID=A0A8H7YN44_AJECA|nr:hypothetical protein I7I52_04240 [Histoplasma capsulatum]QSS74515.1 hypothetical protein I7I50_03332 [Histoplasma capsulatum G186AR]
MSETVDKIADVDMDSDDSTYDDNVMTDTLILSSAAALSALIYISVFSAVSVSSTACAFSAVLNSTSSVHINSSLFFHTDFSLLFTLLEALYIFSSFSLYPPHLSSAPTAFKKTYFHTQVLYNTTHFTSYSLITSLV